MSKYKNKDGIELNFGNMIQKGRDGSGVTLVQEVISEAIDMLEQKNYSRRDKVLGVDPTYKVIEFLKKNFDIKD